MVGLIINISKIHIWRDNNLATLKNDDAEYSEEEGKESILVK